MSEGDPHVIHLYCTVLYWPVSTSALGFAHLLKSLKTNEQMRAIRSDPSGQMSDCERIAQVAHDK